MKLYSYNKFKDKIEEVSISVDGLDSITFLDVVGGKAVSEWGRYVYFQSLSFFKAHLSVKYKIPYPKDRKPYYKNHVTQLTGVVRSKSVLKLSISNSLVKSIRISRFEKECFYFFGYFYPVERVVINLDKGFYNFEIHFKELTIPLEEHRNLQQEINIFK